MRPRWTRPAPCRRTLRALQSYLDGEADVDTAWRVARHLACCDDCFEDADTIRAIKTTLLRLRVAPDGEALARLRVLVATLTDPSTERRG